MPYHQYVTIDRIDLLKREGVEVFPDTEYVGEGDERHQVDIDGSLQRVAIPISDSEWADVAIRERPGYMGGCCSALDQAQSLVIEAMREDGIIENSNLLELGLLLRGHGGVKTIEKTTDADFKLFISDWELLDAVDKIGLVFIAVEPLLKQRSYQEPANRGDSPEDLTHVLASCFHRYSWASLFGTQSAGEAADKHLRQTETKAQILPLLRKLFDQLEEDDQVVEGYALVAKDSDEVLSNMSGLCIYTSLAGAREVIDVWQRSGEPDFDLRQATVSVAAGVALGAIIDIDQP